MSTLSLSLLSCEFFFFLIIMFKVDDFFYGFFKIFALVLCFFNFPLWSLISPFYIGLFEFWFGLILSFVFWIGNKSNINHNEKNKEIKNMVFMMMNVRKKKQQLQRKNKSRDKSKSRKKINDRKTVWRTLAPRLIEKSLLA